MQIQSTDFNFEAPNESLCTFVQPFQIDSFGNRWPKLITVIKQHGNLIQFLFEREIIEMKLKQRENYRMQH